MSIITLSDTAVATTADILQGTRLQTVPSNGYLEFELSASANDATNNMTATIQLPGGSIPLNGARIPAGSAAGVIDDRTALKLRFRVGQGGHCVFGVTLTGTCQVTWRITFRPMYMAAA